MADRADQHAEDVRVVVVQCVCGKLKQQGFICDFCYSTEAQSDGDQVSENLTDESRTDE